MGNPNSPGGDIENPKKEVQTKYGIAFKDPANDNWRFQWNASRAGTPPECNLAEAGRNLPPDATKLFWAEINRALKEAGEDARFVGGPINPRHYFG